MLFQLDVTDSKGRFCSTTAKCFWMFQVFSLRSGEVGRNASPWGRPCFLLHHGHTGIVKFVKSKKD